MNTLNELDLIKTILFNATNIAEALTRLDDCAIAYRASDAIDFYTIANHDISFWKARSNKCPIAVLINDKFVDYDDRKSFLAQQKSPKLASEVPAAASSVDSAEHLSLKQSTVSVDKPRFDYVKIYVKTGLLRNVLRVERRLKRSQAAGYQL